MGALLAKNKQTNMRNCVMWLHIGSSDVLFSSYWHDVTVLGSKAVLLKSVRPFINIKNVGVLVEIFKLLSVKGETGLKNDVSS